MKTITPFSNGTEYMIWQDRNCMSCKQYEHESSERSKAKCKFAYDIDFATVTDGKIPLNTAKWIGYNDMGLNPKCNMWNIPFGPVKLNREAINQLRLF